MNAITLTAASSQDIQSIAQLHANSWRIAYRGMLPDDYLDQRVAADRIAFWTTRFDSVPPDRRLVLKAESEATILGFVCVAPGTAMHLWCVEGNHVARRFYDRQGGKVVETAKRPVAQELSVPELRYWWPPLPLTDR